MRLSTQTARMAGTTTPIFDRYPQTLGNTPLSTSGSNIASTANTNTKAVILPRLSQTCSVSAFLKPSKSNLRYAEASGFHTATASIITINITTANGMPMLSHCP